MKVHELVASFGRAGESANPMDAAHEILESLREEVEAIENSLGYISGIGGNAGQVFYRSLQITLLKVYFPVGRTITEHGRRSCNCLAKKKIRSTAEKMASCAKWERWH